MGIIAFTNSSASSIINCSIDSNTISCAGTAVSFHTPQRHFRTCIQTHTIFSLTHNKPPQPHNRSIQSRYCISQGAGVYVGVFLQPNLQQGQSA